MPLSAPGIIATAIYAFIQGWNEYVYARTFLNSEEKMTLPIGLQKFFTENSSNWPGLMAASFIMSVPVVVLFLVLAALLRASASPKARSSTRSLQPSALSHQRNESRAPMSNVMLRNVVKVYGDVVAVDNVSFEVDDGEFVALVGPSGCGKTTTLNLVAGLIELTDGEIYLGDKQINELDPKDRDLAMVFQNYALYPNKSVSREPRLPAQDAQDEAKRDIKTQVERTAKLLSIDHLLEPAAARALRRSAAARRARPRARPQPARLPDGRAALEPRRQAARADARRAEALPPAISTPPSSTSPTISSKR